MKIGRRRSPALPPITEAIAELTRSIQTAPFPAFGSCRVQFGFHKGGTGKSPATAAVTSLLAAWRSELVAAVDGDPRNNTLRRMMLPDRAPAPLPWLQALPDIRNGRDSTRPGLPMVADHVTLHRYSDLVGRVRVFSNLAAGDARTEQMTAAEYSDFIDWLSTGAQIVATDSGNDKTSDLAIAQLAAADQLVACVKYQQDQLEGVISWLSALYGDQLSYSSDPDSYAGMDDGRFAELARRAVIVVAPGGAEQPQLQPLLDWLNEFTSAGRPAGAGRPNGRVVRIPYDPHVAAGDVLDLAKLGPATTAAYLQVAAHITQNWSLPPLPSRRQAAAAAQSYRFQAPTRPASPNGLAGGLQAWSAPEAPGGARAAEGPAGQVAPPTAEPGTDPAVSAPAGIEPTRAARLVAVPAAGESPVPDAAFALGRGVPEKLGVHHTRGEVCEGCPDPDCSWPISALAGHGD